MKQWYGIQETQGSTSPLYSWLGELLSPCQYETVGSKNGRMVTQTNTYVCFFKFSMSSGN
jgi:hypothetical protein